jgi:hypothetical protein
VNRFISDRATIAEPHDSLSLLKSTKITSSFFRSADYQTGKGRNLLRALKYFGRIKNIGKTGTGVEAGTMLGQNALFRHKK